MPSKWGLVPKKPGKINRPLAGHIKKSIPEEGVEPVGFRFIREFRSSNPADYALGLQITLADVFRVDDLVDVQGTSKGRGFQGVMKRHGFGGGGAGHGSGFHRAPGSIGCSAWPSRVMKGKKLPGRMGNDTVLRKNVRVIDVRGNENIIVLKGPVPGAKKQPAENLLQIAGYRDFSGSGR